LLDALLQEGKNEQACADTIPDNVIVKFQDIISVLVSVILKPLTSYKFLIIKTSVVSQSGADGTSEFLI
jgi:hypothetical protein